MGLAYKGAQPKTKREMRMKSRIALALAVMSALAANAQLNYTFNSDAQGFQNFTWSAAGPAGWAGGSALQAMPGAGGWTLGGSFNFMKEFDFASGAQPVMQALSAGGNGRLSFDLIVDGSSFNAGVANWYNINIAGNSAGANGWTQIDKISGDAWHNADDNALYSTHVDYSFSQLGWSNPEDATGWFQIFFGANSAGDFPIKFYIDNVIVSAVPEPSSVALVGLGVAAWLVRRRKV
jgi:hypothetical protein